MIETEFTGSWPYSPQLFQLSVALYKDHLYVFGGDTTEGSKSALMILNLKSFSWKLLGSGITDKNTYNIHWPEMRGSAGCWIDPDKELFCLLYGVVHDLERNFLRRAPRDFWTYSIKDNRWTRERLRGNFPAVQVKSINF